MTAVVERDLARRRQVLGLLLGAYLVVLGFFLLAPSADPASGAVGLARSVLEGLGLPPSLTVAGRVEFVANVAVFVPVFLLLVLVRPRTRWADCVAYGFAASMAVEVLQALFLSGRSATMSDVVANTLGAAIGAGIGVVLARRATQRG